VLMKLCLDCGRHVQTSEARNGRCPDCRRTYEREKSRRRRKTAARGYDGAWRKLVAEAINRQPFCTYCGTRGSKANQLTGDHKVPVSKGGTARTVADVVVACRSCNSSRGGRLTAVTAGAVTRKPAFGERNERKKIKIAGPKSDSQTEPLIG
jgi:5-methylcytosine-specific restriction endonuclease McrA